MAAVDLASWSLWRGLNQTPHTHHTSHAPHTQGTITVQPQTSVLQSKQFISSSSPHTRRLCSHGIIYENDKNSNYEMETDHNYYEAKREEIASEIKDETGMINEIKNDNILQSNFYKKSLELEKLKSLKLEKDLKDFNFLQKVVQNKINLIEFFEQRFGDFAEMMKVVIINMS